MLYISASRVAKATVGRGEYRRTVYQQKYQLRDPEAHGEHRMFSIDYEDAGEALQANQYYAVTWDTFAVHDIKVSRRDENPRYRFALGINRGLEYSPLSPGDALPEFVLRPSADRPEKLSFDGKTYYKQVVYLLDPTDDFSGQDFEISHDSPDDFLKKGATYELFPRNFRRSEYGGLMLNTRSNFAEYKSRRVKWYGSGQPGAASNAS